MAVPKKRTSKSKSRSRRTYWVRQALHQSKKANSLAKSVATGKPTSFIYISKEYLNN